MTTVTTPRAEQATTTGGPTADRIRVTNLVKHFRRRDGSEVRAIDDISLTVGPGEFLVLLGPSGCGKTTLLRSLAGREQPDQGRIELDGKTVFSADEAILVPPERRRVPMMFQAYALWPHLTAFENVAFPLRAQSKRLRGRKDDEVRERVMAMLERVQCGHLSQQYPGSISGGQQQRIALARALVSDHPVVFFDEPLSNVDARVREELRLQLFDLQRAIGFSAVYVTHDQSEALALADRVAVLRGRPCGTGRFTGRDLSSSSYEVRGRVRRDDQSPPRHRDCCGRSRDRRHCARRRPSRDGGRDRARRSGDDTVPTRGAPDH